MKRNRYILALTISISLVVALALTAGYFYSQKSDYARYIETANRRSFAQLTTSLTSIDSNLKKLQYADAGPTLTTLTANVWRESEVALYALSTMPLEDARLERFQKFIAQAGDYAYSLLKSSAGGTPTGEEQKVALASLASVAADLAIQMSALQERLDADDTYIQMSARDISLSQKPQGAPVANDFSQTEEEFPEYATLIYDGPFSEHIKTLEPLLLGGKAMVNEQAATEAAQAFLNTQSDLKLLHQGEGIIPYYSFSFDESVTIEVSRQGGVVVSMTNNRELKTARLDAEAAVEKAAAYLAARGYDSMKTSYYTVFENIITVNFAYTLGDVIVYPDLIKVGVALDDGSVVRFDAAGYIMNHRPREIAQPAVSRDAAWTDVPEGLEVISENTALIPTSGKSEVLCHEFVCKDKNGRHVIIYINAQTGLQENILLLIEDANGVLTI